MGMIRVTKPIWINGQPLDVGATVNLKPRLMTDLIQTGAAVEIDCAEMVQDIGSTPISSTKKTTKKKTTKKGEKDGSITREDKGTQ
jgi:hypothetical protein